MSNKCMKQRISGGNQQKICKILGFWLERCPSYGFNFPLKKIKDS